MTDATVLSMADPQPKTGPALSATSDMPSGKSASPALSESVNKPTDAKAADAGKETPPAADAEETAADEAGQVEAEASARPSEDGDQTPPSVKRQFTLLRKERREADERAARLEANLARALVGLEKLGQASEGTKSADVKDPRPVREKFDTPDKYDDALIEWSARMATRTAEAELAKTRTKEIEAQRAQETKRENDKLVADWNERKTAFMKEHPDFEEVAESEDVKITLAMSHAILNDESGPALAYFLGENHDEADRISKLSPARQATELGRIAARLTAKPVSTPKPAPIKPLGSRATAATPAWDAQSYSEKRLAEERAKRVPFIGARPN